jgi:hypothetical protein
MGALFEELDWRPAQQGAISLRRRRNPLSGAQVYEIKLDDDFLMSSLWTEGEVQLARLGLAATSDASLDVAVGRLGLGYTAQATLDDARVRSVVVVEALAELIEWHEKKLVPLGDRSWLDPGKAQIPVWSHCWPKTQPIA